MIYEKSEKESKFKYANACVLVDINAKNINCSLLNLSKNIFNKTLENIWEKKEETDTNTYKQTELKK